MPVIGTDHETARRVSLGMACVEGLEDFIKAHGTPTACGFCWAKLSIEERHVVGRAVHEESTKEAFRQRANKNKQRRAQSNG
jgi:hypothetical protein